MLSLQAWLKELFCSHLTSDKVWHQSQALGFAAWPSSRDLTPTDDAAALSIEPAHLRGLVAQAEVS